MMFKSEKEIFKALEPFFECSTLRFLKGIPHFLSPDSGTQLDDIEYDSIYKGDINKNIYDFDITADQVAPLFDQSYQAVLEIGAGTGRFSVGFFEHGIFEKYIISDVSIKMLLQLKLKLNQRIESRANLEEKLGNVLFLGLDCENFQSRQNVFDLVVGSGVLHLYTQVKKGLW